MVMSLDDQQPLFRKNITNTDRNHMMALPVTLIPYIWGHNDPNETHREFQVVDRYGEVWNLQGRMRRDQAHNPKPEVYGAEWKRYVKNKGLKVGDKLIFYRHPDPGSSGVVFVLTVERSMRLLGSTFPARTEA